MKPTVIKKKSCTNKEDKDMFQNIHEVKEQNQDMDPLDPKPWRRPGADITDYFNYGFNEDSWKAYCRRHSRFHVFQKQHIAKVMREQAKCEEVMSCSSSTSSRKSQKSRRQKKAAAAESRDRPGSSSHRKKARPCHTDAAKDTQVAAGISHKKNNATVYDLPGSANVRTIRSFVVPAPSFFHFHQTSTSANIQRSSTLGNFEEPSTSLYQYFVGNTATDSGVIDTAHAWERHVKRKRERNRDRSRGQEHDRKRQRHRGEGKQSSSSSCHSGKTQKKHSDYTEHVYRHHRTEGVTGKKTQKDEEERLQNSSRSRSSNISRRDEREDRKTRHYHTKKKDVGRPQKATEKRT